MPIDVPSSGTTRGDFRKAGKLACREVGVEGKPGRDLRHTAVRNMVRAASDPAVTMKINGHRTRSVFDRYSIISDDGLREAITKTARSAESLPTTSTVRAPRKTVDPSTL